MPSSARHADAATLIYISGIGESNDKMQETSSVFSGNEISLSMILLHIYDDCINIQGNIAFL